MRLMHLAVIPALFTFSALCAAQTALPSAGQAVPGLEAVDELVQSTLAKYGHPGASLALAFQGRMVLNKSYGYAKKGLMNSTPMVADQPMRIASMSKWITTSALLKAAELGKLNLDQPLSEVMGWSQTAGDYTDPRAMKVTLRQLAQNHAGWTTDRSSDAMFDRVPPCPGGAQRWVSRVRLDADPGQLYSYSNINFCLAQLAIEKATGQSYVDFVKAQIAQPLGITSWRFAKPAPEADEPDYHTSNPSEAAALNQLDIVSLGGAGAWVSTAADYVRFLSGVRGYQGKALLKPESVAQMTQRPGAPDSAGKPSYYGLGTNVRVLDGGRYNAWHHGSLPGTTSYGVTYAGGWTAFVVFNRRLPVESRDAAAAEFDRALFQILSKAARPEGEIRP